MPVQECRLWRHCCTISATCIILRHRLHARSMHPRIIWRHKSPRFSLLGTHFSKASTTHENDLISAIFFHNPPTSSPFLKLYWNFFELVSVAAFALFFQFIRYIISTHRNLLLTSLVIWIYAMVNFFWIVVLIAFLRTSPWTFFWIAVDINCCYLDLGMDIFRDCCGHKLLLLGHRHGHFSELLWI